MTIRAIRKNVEIFYLIFVFYAYEPYEPLQKSYILFSETVTLVEPSRKTKREKVNSDQIHTFMMMEFRLFCHIRHDYYHFISKLMFVYFSSLHMLNYWT